MPFCNLLALRLCPICLKRSILWAVYTPRSIAPGANGFLSAPAICLLSGRNSSGRSGGLVPDARPWFRFGKATAPLDLCAFYSQSAKKEIGRAIESKDFAVRSALDSLSVHFLEEDSVRVADPEGRSFNDIDTREDYERAKKF